MNAFSFAFVVRAVTVVLSENLRINIVHDTMQVSGKLDLRTVPSFVTAHTFCASLDTRVTYGWCLLIQGYLCAV